MILAGITFARGNGDRVQVYAVDLCSLQDADVLKPGSGAHDRLHNVVEHRVVSLDLIVAGPASDELGLLVYSRVGDVSDVS